MDNTAKKDVAVVYSIYMAFVLSRPARLLLVVLLGIFSLAHFSHAALPCGDIVAPEYFFGTSHLSSLILSLIHI